MLGVDEVRGHLVENFLLPDSAINSEEIFLAPLSLAQFPQEFSDFLYGKFVVLSTVSTRMCDC